METQQLARRVWNPKFGSILSVDLIWFNWIRRQVLAIRAVCFLNLSFPLQNFWTHTQPQKQFRFSGGTAKQTKLLKKLLKRQKTEKQPWQFLFHNVLFGQRAIVVLAGEQFVLLLFAVVIAFGGFLWEQLLGFAHFALILLTITLSWRGSWRIKLNLWRGSIKNFQTSSKKQ